MGLPFYLAMTAWEYQNCPSPPKKAAWMACHFSSYKDGLSNIPEQFPSGGVLMVNDRIPPSGHRPDSIAQQLLHTVKRLSPKGVILDFQRPFQADLQEIASEILSVLPCPVAITEVYCHNWQGAVLAPPVPLGIKIEAHLQKWHGKDIWLEVSKMPEQLTVTAEGCCRKPQNQLPGMPVFENEMLFCHYSTEIMRGKAVFSLWRTEEDVSRMLEVAEAFGVRAAIGLYQEFC